MAEQLISPGSLLREQDISFIPPQIIESDFSIIGPTAKGRINIPTRITSYSEYIAKFGDSYKGEVDGKTKVWSFLTTIAVFNYFQNNGESILVTRVVPSMDGTTAITWSPAEIGVEVDKSETSTPDLESLFTIETLAEGEDQNSDGTNGSKENIKIEIANVNISRGTFTLIVRRGDDTDNNKIILESYSNLNLDPNSDNFISKRIGNTKFTLETTDGHYIQEVGEFANVSNFIRIKEVAVEMLKYNSAEVFESGVTWGDLIGGLEDLSTLTFTGGEGTLLSDGSFFNYIAGTDGETQGVMPADYEDAIKLMANQDEYIFNIVATPGLIYGVSEHASLINQLDQIIKTRGDAIYIIDPAVYETPVNSVAQVGQNIDSSYAAAYWPWLQINDPVTGKLVWVPASTLVPGVYKFTDTTGETWDAPAGITRGGLGIVRQAERKVTVTQRNTLYDSGINAIATFPGVGIVVYGNKTLQNAQSALDRVNVRRLIIEIKGFVKRIADGLVFEPNSISTRNRFLNSVNPRMEFIQQRNGLFAYKVVMDDTINTPDVIDRNELRGAIYVQPTRTSEFIYIDFIIQPTGAEFPQ